MFPNQIIFNLNVGLSMYKYCNRNIGAICAICPRFLTTDLCDASVGSLQTRFNALRRFVGKLDRRLQKSDGELRMNLSCYPQTELLINILS